jgi:hypothetical protein
MEAVTFRRRKPISEPLPAEPALVEQISFCLQNLPSADTEGRQGRQSKEVKGADRGCSLGEPTLVTLSIFIECLEAGRPG